MLWRKRRVSTLPSKYQPCLLTSRDTVPTGPDWIHEVKHDGYRALVRKIDGRPRFHTRGGVDWTAKFPAVAETVLALKAQSFAIDGEAVWCGPDGIADFAKLHSQARNAEVFVFAFDLLEVDGEDLRELPLEHRKTRLRKLLARAKPGLQYVDHHDGDGDKLFAAACKMGLEGIVSKRRASVYRPGRSQAWVKVKNPACPAMMRVEEGHWG